MVTLAYAVKYQTVNLKKTAQYRHYTQNIIKMKKEFDMFRLKGEAHPLMDLYGVEAVPFRHRDLDEWRTKGIDTVHSASNLKLFGIVDDVWEHVDGSLGFIL